MLSPQVDQYPLLVMLCKLSGSYEIATIINGQGFSTPSGGGSSFWSTPMDFSGNTVDLDAGGNEHFSTATDFPLLDLSTATNATGRRRNGSTLSNDSSSTRGQLDANLVASELWQKYEIYMERLKPELTADEQRLARELMRKEQDRAYEESLEQDRIKVSLLQSMYFSQMLLKRERGFGDPKVSWLCLVVIIVEILVKGLLEPLPLGGFHSFLLLTYTNTGFQLGLGSVPLARFTINS